MNSERLAYALSNKRKVPIGYVKRTHKWPEALKREIAGNEDIAYSNCFGFALWLVGLASDGPFWSDSGYIAKVAEAGEGIERPLKGCLLLLWDQEGILEHAAVYVGDGWYMHQAGEGGPVGRHRLKHVLDLYPDCNLQFVIPPVEF